MASIKVKFRPSDVSDREGIIYYQIIHERKSRLLFPDYHIYSSEWDNKRSTVIAGLENGRKDVLISVKNGIRRDLERFRNIVNKLENHSLSYTVDDVIDEFRHYAEEYSLFKYMQKRILILKKNGKIRTSETYTVALKSFMQFRQGKDIMLDHITPDVMEAYEAWQKNKGNSPNTVSFYTRILRAVYNRAVEEEIIVDRQPFRHVYTGIEKTVKRALPINIVKKINNLNLSDNPALDFARDMFIMSFMLRGMSFIDMAFLKKPI